MKMFKNMNNKGNDFTDQMKKLKRKKTAKAKN